MDMVFNSIYNNGFASCFIDQISNYPQQSLSPFLADYCVPVFNCKKRIGHKLENKYLPLASFLNVSFLWNSMNMLLFLSPWLKSGVIKLTVTTELNLLLFTYFQSINQESNFIVIKKEVK